jgi:hypothetical protein
MQKSCRQCAQKFEITDEDLKFYDKVSPVFADKKYLIPPPTFCPDCRQQRRKAFRNEYKMYQRKCDLTGRQIISIFSPDKPYTVYDAKEWWSDKWNPLDYGTDFDYSRPFFEQFDELIHKVPQLNLLGYNNENSDYTNYVSHLKNCYLVFSSDFNRDCMYGKWIEYSKDSVDNFMLDNSELAYESIFSQYIYNGIFIVNSSHCHDSAFLYDCKSCSNCFMSSGLRNKQYCIRNKQFSKEEYEKNIKSIDTGSYKNINNLKKEFTEMKAVAPHLYINRNGRLEASNGDYLVDVKNCSNSYFATRVQDCAYAYDVFEIKDSMDITCASGELGYENCETVPMPFRSAFNYGSYTGGNLYYTLHCMNNCNDCFGCVSLKHQKYCILNRQYSKEKYEELVTKIIEHMKKTGEWGEFLPIRLSPFGYNETEADIFFPMTREEALKSGAKWKEEDKANRYQGPKILLPDNITEIKDEITKQILCCESCAKNYRIITQELEFYRRMKLPLPHKCFDCRNRERHNLLNERKLYDRKCDKCKTELKSTYKPDYKGIVYCESCYLKEVY